MLVPEIFCTLVVKAMPNNYLYLTRDIPMLCSPSQKRHRWQVCTCKKLQ